MSEHDLEWKHAKIKELLAHKSKIEPEELEQVFDEQALSDYYSDRQTTVVKHTLETLTVQTKELRASIDNQRLINADLKQILQAKTDEPAKSTKASAERIEQLKDSIRYVLKNYIAGPYNLDPNEADTLLVGLMKHELGFVAPMSLQTVQFLVANHLVGTKPAGHREVVLEFW